MFYGFKIKVREALLGSQGLKEKPTYKEKCEYDKSIICLSRQVMH